jgi:hypothetical protein
MSISGYRQALYRLSRHPKFGGLFRPIFEARRRVVRWISHLKPSNIAHNRTQSRTLGLFERETAARHDRQAKP